MEALASEWHHHHREALGAVTNYLVCGPPCAGKSTWVERHAPGDALVVCFDTIARTLGHNGPSRPPFKVGRAAEAEVQRLLATIERDEIDGAYIIRTMAGADRRTEMAGRLRAEVVLLAPDIEELTRRASQRPDPATTMRDIARWFEREQQGATLSRWRL